VTTPSLTTNARKCASFSKSTLCKKIYMGVTGRRLADSFREHLRDVGENDTDASKPAHSHHDMTICGLSLNRGSTEGRGGLEQGFIFRLGALYPRGINERLSFHWYIHKFMSPCFHQWESSFTLPYKPTTPHDSSIRFGGGLALETSAFWISHGGD